MHFIVGWNLIAFLSSLTLMEFLWKKELLKSIFKTKTFFFTHFRNCCQQISTFMIKNLPFHTTENLPKRFHFSRIFFPRFPLTLHWYAFHTLRKARKTRWACSWKFPFKQKTSWLFLFPRIQFYLINLP